MNVRERDAWEAVRDNCRLALRFVGSRTSEELSADIEALYAAVRALEIVSEASRRLRGTQQGRFPETPWRMIEDAGNVYRHGYDLLLVDRIRETTLNWAPRLLAVAESALGEDLG